MEAIIILFVIYGIVSSIAKKRNEERKRQERATKTRLQNAYPPSEWHRSPPQMPYEQPDVPQQVYNEPPRHVMPFSVPSSPYYVQEPTPDQLQSNYEPPAEQEEPAPSQALYDKFFNAVDKWMGDNMPLSAEPAPETRYEGEKAFEPVLTVADKLKREQAPSAADKLAREAAPTAVRRESGFALGMSRKEIINGVIWSEILTRPQERVRRRAF